MTTAHLRGIPGQQTPRKGNEKKERREEEEGRRMGVGKIYSSLFMVASLVILLVGLFSLFLIIHFLRMTSVLVV